MKRIALGILAASVVTSAQADPMYISDKLVVNVYAEADQESGKVTTLDSGDAVEAIEKLDGYTHVRLADDREGWVKSSYLSNQVPAIVRLKELEKERGASAPIVSPQLADEVKQLKEQNAVLQAQLATAKTAAAPVVAPITTQAPTHQDPVAGQQTGSNQRSPAGLHPVGWGTGFFAVGGVIGFVIGYQALARRIRRKYGNVRIY